MESTRTHLNVKNWFAFPFSFLIAADSGITFHHCQCVSIAVWASGLLTFVNLLFSLSLFYAMLINTIFLKDQFSSVQSLSRVQLLATP